MALYGIEMTATVIGAGVGFAAGVERVPWWQLRQVAFPFRQGRGKGAVAGSAGGLAVGKGGGPDGLGRMYAVLGRSAAAGEGTGSAFLGRGRSSRRGGDPCGHIIHLIAIGKRRPGQEEWPGSAEAEMRARERRS